MKCSFIIFLFFAVFALGSCKTASVKNAGPKDYDFSSPDESIVLPDILHEVSGIVCIDSSTIACVQDEKGTLYFYNLADKKILSELKFFSKGDYEGIARVFDTIFVLRSDGLLIEISD